jgi:hypothetical protein
MIEDDLDRLFRAAVNQFIGPGRISQWKSMRDESRRSELSQHFPSQLQAPVVVPAPAQFGC